MNLPVHRLPRMCLATVDPNCRSQMAFWWLGFAVACRSVIADSSKARPATPRMSVQAALFLFALAVCFPLALFCLLPHPHALRDGEDFPPLFRRLKKYDFLSVKWCPHMVTAAGFLTPLPAAVCAGNTLDFPEVRVLFLFDRGCLALIGTSMKRTLPSFFETASPHAVAYTLPPCIPMHNFHRRAWRLHCRSTSGILCGQSLPHPPPSQSGSGPSLSPPFSSFTPHLKRRSKFSRRGPFAVPEAFPPDSLSS